MWFLDILDILDKVEVYIVGKKYKIFRFTLKYNFIKRVVCMRFVSLLQGKYVTNLALEIRRPIFLQL